MLPSGPRLGPARSIRSNSIHSTASHARATQRPRYRAATVRERFPFSPQKPTPRPYQSGPRRGAQQNSYGYRANGSGRTWNFTTRLAVPLPVSLWNGARVAHVDHKPLPFHPVFGSSMRPSMPFAKKPVG